VVKGWHTERGREYRREKEGRDPSRKRGDVAVYSQNKQRATFAGSLIVLPRHGRY